MKNATKTMTAAAMLLLGLMMIGQAEETALKPQTTCPVMGGEVNTNLYVDVDGQRVYVCCGGCLAPLKADPEKYLKKLEEMGQKPEQIGTTPEITTEEEAAHDEQAGHRH